MISDELLERIGIDTGRELFAPSHFEFSDVDRILEFVTDQPLAHLISVVEGKVRVSAAPLVFEREVREPGGRRYKFIGHIAQRNPQSACVAASQDAVALIPGPNAYISPNWNVATAVLPTWSYVTVQLRGQFEPVTGLSETRALLERTVDHFERRAGTHWTLEEAPPALVGKLIHHIVAFRFIAWEMQGIARVSQNRTEADRLGIVTGLLNRGDPGSLQIAELMVADLPAAPEPEGEP